MARLTDDAGETFGNVPRPRSDLGNGDADYGLRTSCVTLSLPTNMTKLRKQGQNNEKPHHLGLHTKGCISWPHRKPKWGRLESETVDLCE
ncbi:unnamed protein product [Protopolystoma xenopodis]|uniref:Uncharacterized protein n=1 Tax=Protopolystoma xenopodis TaxID=117903 RepID=A0A3S5AYV6_9PLAT|nr:unnamed protein product [Protopolystoma xenopodis]